MAVDRLGKGEIVCALGITEPGTGSDMANLTTRAVRSGDHYLQENQLVGF